MTQPDCPYCSLAKKKGELFCSRHNSNMASLKSGVFYINTNSLEECDWHVTRLSLNFNLDGPQIYHAGSRAYSISPQKYLLINEGQLFKTSVKSAVPNRMVTLAFQVGLAEKIIHALDISDQALLDDPFRSSTGSPEFLERTYSIDSKIQSTVSDLIDVEYEQTEVEQRLENILTHVLMQQLNVRKEILSIAKSRASTRIEIYRRLHWSLDFLHENFTRDITVDELAKEACFSTFHYKRLFTELFENSPYQYLINLRLEKACSLLQSDLKIHEVCRHVGWKDPSSFARLFRKRFATTPEQFRSRLQSIH
jgi:AraC family transcriptional regulator